MPRYCRSEGFSSTHCPSRGGRAPCAGPPTARAETHVGEAACTRADPGYVRERTDRPAGADDDWRREPKPDSFTGSDIERPQMNKLARVTQPLMLSMAAL